MNDFLQATDIIDWRHPDVCATAYRLTAGDPVATARQCYEFVRDEIPHSYDFRLNPVTCRASEALAHRTGYCYAKSHLLAALLRANGIPAGFCYQRLRLAEYGAPDRFCLHGLNAVHLPEIGWYRVDARGNKPGVEARFDPPAERLAFAPSQPGEANLPGIWAEPLGVVVSAMMSHPTYDALAEDLPDMTPDELAMHGQPSITNTSSVRMQLPFHLRNLAKVDGDVAIEVEGPVTQRSVLDALEVRFPALRGTVRDYGTGERRPFLRFFACGEDISFDAPDALLPPAIRLGKEPFMIVGAVAGG